jgi:glycosyltransferase involved in cell wall biosynthesis
VLTGGAQGREAYRAELLAAIAATGLDDSVRLSGPCGDAAAAMAAADLVVMPSTEPETFGRAAVEAQAAGRPVIVSDLGAAPETVLAPPDVPEAMRTGWRVPAGDAGSLAAAIAGVLAMAPVERAALGGRGRVHVAGRFSVERMQQSTLAVYSELCAPADFGYGR